MSKNNVRASKKVWAKPTVKCVAPVRETKSGILNNAGFEQAPIYNLS